MVYEFHPINSAILNKNRKILEIKTSNEVLQKLPTQEIKIKPKNKNFEKQVELRLKKLESSTTDIMYLQSIYAKESSDNFTKQLSKVADIITQNNEIYFLPTTDNTDKLLVKLESIQAMNKKRVFLLFVIILMLNTAFIVGIIISLIPAGG